MLRRHMLADTDTGGVEATAATAARTRDRGARTFKPTENMCVKCSTKKPFDDEWKMEATEHFGVKEQDGVYDPKHEASCYDLI